LAARFRKIAHRYQQATSKATRRLRICFHAVDGPWISGRDTTS
jgi:hypothetical protein